MEAFIQWGIDFMVGISNNVSALDGRLAFVTGAVSWFLVEQAIRRLAGIVRIAILLGFLSALGYGIWQILPLIQDSGG
ncbi:MAG: hypothetical protein ACPGSK_07715 [Alphaproteobacteria bacterium]|jgi:hypothetical protein